jgi:hypothetical protein
MLTERRRKERERLEEADRERQARVRELERPSITAPCRAPVLDRSSRRSDDLRSVRHGKAASN